ncbi:MAG: hypothetical protein RLZZ241_882 [Bacteroidota bacterium]
MFINTTQGLGLSQQTNRAQESQVEEAGIGPAEQILKCNKTHSPTYSYGVAFRGKLVVKNLNKFTWKSGSGSLQNQYRLQKWLLTVKLPYWLVHRKNPNR